MSAGGIQATSDANGRFNLDSVPVGPSVTLRSQRTGFLTSTEAIPVGVGSNIHDIQMTRQDLYEVPGFAVYVPPDVSTVRGVIIHSGGDDSRGVGNGECTASTPAICEGQRQLRLLYLALAASHGLAIMGPEVLTDGTGSDARVIAALDAVAVMSGRPELAQAPLFISGISGGAPEAYGFTLRRPDRVIGFTVVIGLTPSTVRSAASQSVPGYVLLAELDAQVDNAALTRFFVANRAEGALWTFAVEPGAAHVALSPAARGLIANWMNTILGLRLPPTGPPVLRSIDEASGWLGNRASFAVAPYADYAENQREASWLPSQETAEAWQRFVTPTPP